MKRLIFLRSAVFGRDFLFFLYFFSAVLGAGILFSLRNCFALSSDFSPIFDFFLLLTLFFLPLLIFRSFQKFPERRPFSHFFRLSLLLLFPPLWATLFPLLFLAFGKISLSHFFLCFLGYFLTVCAALCVCILLRSRIRNSFVFFLSSFSLLLLSYFSLDLCDLFLSGVPHLSKAVSFLSLPFAYDDFCRGFFPLQRFVFLLTVCVFSLLFATRCEKNEKSNQKRRFFTSVCKNSALIFLLILSVSINLSISFLPYRLRFLGNGDPAFSLSDTLSLPSEDTFERNVTCYYLSCGGETFADPDLFSFLSRFCERSSCLTVKILDPDRVPLPEEVDLSYFEDQSILLSDGEKTVFLKNSDLYYYFNRTFSLPLSPSDYFRVLQNLQTKGDDLSLSLVSLLQNDTVAYFCGERLLSDAVAEFTTEPNGSVASEVSSDLPAPNDRLLDSFSLQQSPPAVFPLLFAGIFPFLFLFLWVFLPFFKKKRAFLRKSL